MTNPTQSDTTMRERVAAAIYLAMYGDKGGRWECVEPRHQEQVWGSYADAAIAAMSAPAEPVAWKPIEMAPFNELVWCFEPHDMGGFMFAGGKNNGGNWYNNLDDARQYPTHWMPLPVSPSTHPAAEPITEPQRMEERAAIVAMLEAEAGQCEADMKMQPDSIMAPLYGARMIYYRQAAGMIKRGEHLRAADLSELIASTADEIDRGGHHG